MKAREQYKHSHDMYQLAHQIDIAKQSLELIEKQILQSMSGETKAITHVVTDMDTIRSITRKYYNDIDLWRKLAKFNNVGTELESGTILTIPDKEILNGI